MYSFHRYRTLPTEIQVNALSLHGVGLDLAYTTKGAEAVLFAYNGFYVELLVEKFTDEILGIHCFRSLKKLDPYLQQVDISEINPLLVCNR